MNEALARAGAALLGADLAGTFALQGGSLSQIIGARLADGRRIVVKGGPTARREAGMLKAIAQAGVPVPAVLGGDEATLVIAYLSTEGGVSSAWTDLGAVLSCLHVTTGTRYGWHDDHAFGTLPIVNAWNDKWPDFWARNRLLDHLPHLSGDLARRIGRLALELPERLPSNPRPVLLHGDLWGGNVLVTGGTVIGLIDPASCFGHAEVDLAMLTLFDSPGAAFRDAYGPFEPGFQERLPIYRLWPALVHFRLFGAGYRSMVETCLAEAGV